MVQNSQTALAKVNGEKNFIAATTSRIKSGFPPRFYRLLNEQFVNLKAVTTGNFFKGEQSRIPLNAKLIKLVKLVSNPAFLGGAFLRPAVLFSQLPDALLKTFVRQFFHS